MATVASVKAKIQGLIDKANETTNRRDLQLSPAFDALIEGYGRGDSGGIIDVTELPEIEKAKEGYVYRLISETPETAEIWMAVLDGNSTHMETLQHMFEQEGIMANTTTTIVSALPSTMQPINEATLTIPLYVLESTGVAYLSLDGTNTNVVTLGQLFEGVDGGWIRHINEIYGDKLTTAPTFFCLRVEGSTETKGLYIAIERVWYYYKRIIDVEKLPTGADNNAIYRVGKYVTKDLYICLAGGELRPFVDYVKEIYGDNANLNKVEFVDALPSPHETATLYILNTTGAMYTDVNGTLQPYGNDALSVMVFGTYYGLCDADAVDLNYPGLYAVREGIVIEKYCVKVGGKWIEFKSKSIFQEYAAGGLTEIKGEDLLGVTLLADHALSNYKPLKKATIPSNVANIGDSAFENCENLKEIVFHDNLMGIGNRAFYGCKSITEIDWYALRNLWDLGQEAFANCTSLKHAAPTADDNGGGYIFNANPSGMFDGCTALETATIDFKPDAGFLGVGGMFEGCTSLHTFTDNVGMDCMPVGMFKGCSSLKDIYVPTTKQYWSYWEKGEKWDQGTPDYVIHCTDGDILKSDAESGSDDRPDEPVLDGAAIARSIVDGSITEYSDSELTSVADYGFYLKSKLTQVDLPNVTKIGRFGFNQCTSLTSANIPKATSLGPYAFQTCRALQSIDLPVLNSLEEYVFDGCYSITSIGAPNLTTIGQSAFNVCKSLLNIDLSKVTSIGSSAFRSCEALTSISIPNITTLGTYTFKACNALTSIDLPKATSIGNEALANCINLTSVNIPEAKSLGNYEFNMCNALPSIDLPKVTSIGDYAFSNCYVLKSVVLRSSTVCTLTNAQSFIRCYRILGEVHATYNPNGDKDGYFYVPRALVDSYKSATNWSTFESQFRALEDYTVDGTTTGALDENKI